MKKYVIILSVAFLLPLLGFSQTSSIDKLYEKYAGKDYFTSINISSEMFKLAAGLSQNMESEDAKELNDLVNQIDGMKILIFEDSLKKSKIDFISELNKSVNFKDFAELMRVEEKDGTVRFLTKKENGSKISEMLMIAEDGGEVVVMSFTGSIDLQSIGKLAKTMNMKGMENLDKLNE
ncbi:MAG: DUF4252 domain-containing protein [Bacteroidales bacterium]|jgi:hypothetical protein|nr:DUF4252 domain-containing protein [Bacteroidales bacterium]HOI32360.1 DUF4252 domain-containing protein [Bacteroidales bacterium]